MNRDQIVAAIENNLPFSIMMADGREYTIPHKDYISLPPRGTFAIVYDDHGKFYALPLLTMTGLSQQQP